MSVSVEEICAYIESWAPSSWAESWDRVGLQIGSLRRSVNHLGLALELTPEVVAWMGEQAIEALLTHHPVFFKPLQGLREEDPWEGLLIRLVKTDRVVISYHTNLDSAPGGVSEVLMEALGVRVERALRPLSPETPEVGLGRVGFLESPLTLSELSQRLAQLIDFPVFQVGEDKEVRRVALCAGAGADLWKEVLQNQAEVYITGEVKHHLARDLEMRGLALIVADHYAMEAYFLKTLRERLAARFPGLKISLYLGRSPFHPVQQFPKEA